MTHAASVDSFCGFVSKRESKLAAFVKNPGFTRKGKLGLKHTVGQVLFMAFNRNQNGYEISSDDYFSQISKPENAVVRSSFTEARAKVSWKAFEFLLGEINCRPRKEDLWRGFRIKSVDGTYLTLPNEKEVLAEFPCREGKQNFSPYPKCLLITIEDAVTEQPLEAVWLKHNGSERAGLLSLTSISAGKDLLLLDRGFSGVEVFKELIDRGVDFIARVRSDEKCSLAVRNFLASEENESVTNLSRKIKGKIFSVKVRLIRGGNDHRKNPIVLATSLRSKRRYPKKDVQSIYLKRWGIETMYRRLKRHFNVEAFHAKTLNGVLQEIFAGLVALALTAVVSYLAKFNRPGRVNLKAVSESLRRNFSWLLKSATQPGGNNCITTASLGRIRCHSQPGRKNPRIARKPRPIWARAAKNRARKKRVRSRR